MNEYEIEINMGAINRTPSENEILYIEGNDNDLMQALDDNFVDCVLNNEDELLSYGDWAKIYEAEADYSGSAIVLKIIKNGEEIFRNSDYNEFIYDEENE